MGYSPWGHKESDTTEVTKHERPHTHVHTLTCETLPADAGDFEFNPWVREIPWRRRRQSAPVFLPGKSHGQRSLVGCSPWGRK